MHHEYLENPKSIGTCLDGCIFRIGEKYWIVPEWLEPKQMQLILNSPGLYFGAVTSTFYAPQWLGQS